MDEATAWRVAVLMKATHIASGLRHQAQDRIAQLRREGHKKRSPELRAAQDAYRGHHCFIETADEAIDLLVPPSIGKHRCSQGWRRFYTPEGAEIMSRARVLATENGVLV